MKQLLCIILLMTGAAAWARPNIVLVFIDDMGYSDVSCFGGEDVKTQHIDQLAEEGLRFTQFCVNSPICSPSRVAISTGQYPQRWRITSFLNNRKSNRKRGMAQWLDPKAPMLARALKQAGYATGHFGKWHMGGQRDVDNAPPITAYGFDESLTNFEGMGPKLLPLTIKPGWETARKIWDRAEILGGPYQWMMRYEITGGFVDAALAFIDRAEKEDKPFYINLWPDDVHTPLFPPLDKWGDTKRELYTGVLDAMDEQLGPLFERIRSDESLRENTLIIFCSDNGPESGAGTSDPFRAHKTWMYEGGVRSPLIVWAPGLLNPTAVGQINDESFFSAIDLNRSLYEITGAALPAGTELDGENVADTLLGRSKDGRGKPVFFRRPPDRPGNDGGIKGDNPDLVVRIGHWKLLMNIGGTDVQLYDLKADPEEKSNLARLHPERVEKMRVMLEAWNETMPVDGSDPDFKRSE